MNLKVIAFRTTKLKSLRCCQHAFIVPNFSANKYAVCQYATCEDKFQKELWKCITATKHLLIIKSKKGIKVK